MSIYQFLSSDSPLREVKGPPQRLLSIEELESMGGAMPKWYHKDMKIDRTKKIVLWVEKEEELDEIDIHDYWEARGYYAEDHYSDKDYNAALAWHYTDKRAEKLIEYIKEHLSAAHEIELWTIWLDEWLEDDPPKPVIKECPVDELTIADINEVLGQRPYDRPRCLVVYRDDANGKFS